MLFQESGWQFEFDKPWSVTKFDSHRYYQALSGSGYKGLDFIALKPHEQLLLIEVKNYRDQKPPSSIELSDVFQQKLKDSLKVIEIIHKYYHRNWAYRMVYPIIKRYPSLFGERGFWTEAIDLIHQNKFHSILWLDAPMAPPNFIVQTDTLIKAQLSPSMSFSLEPYAAQAEALGLRIKCC